MLLSILDVLKILYLERQRREFNLTPIKSGAGAISSIFKARKVRWFSELCY